MLRIFSKLWRKRSKSEEIGSKHKKRRLVRLVTLPLVSSFPEILEFTKTRKKSAKIPKKRQIETSDTQSSKRYRNVPQKLSLKFYKTGHLKASDYILDGFLDIGRDFPLSENTEITVQNLKTSSVETNQREFLLIDRRNDERLAKLISDIQTLSSEMNETELLRFVAILTSDTFGGRQDFTNNSTEFSSKCFSEIIQMKISQNSNVIKLCDLSIGLCRHRALLFKVLCDEVLEERVCVVRGFRGEAPHCWNIVRIGEEWKILDILDSPYFFRDLHVFSRPIQDKCENMYVPQFSSFLEEFGDELAKYELGKLIDKGSFSEIYAIIAKNELLAVKITKFKDCERSISFSLLLKELSFISLLKHPNIVKFYGYHIFRNSLFVFMELVYGVNMATFVGGLKPIQASKLNKRLGISSSAFSVKTSRNMLRTCDLLCILNQFACAVAYLHEKSLVHRDIKCENVLIQRVGSADPSEARMSDFKVILCDLSNCVEIPQGRHGVNADVAGSVVTMAPEVHRKSVRNSECCQYTAKCDVYSFGVVAYELLTERRLHHRAESFTMDESVLMPSIRDFEPRSLDIKRRRKFAHGIHRIRSKVKKGILGCLEPRLRDRSDIESVRRWIDDCTAEWRNLREQFLSE